MPKLPKQFMKPSLALLPRVADQLSFLYVDIARIAKDDNGVAALVSTPERGTERIYLPTASIAAVMLGPGTSITQPAARQILRDGSSIVLCGTMLSRCYGAMTHDDLTTRWLHAQVNAWADPDQRAEVARRLYVRRFSDPELAEGRTIAQLRGMEGHRVKAAYRQHAQRHGIRFRRAYDAENFESGDPVNQALTAANQVLYGVVHATILALGMSPALGFIHTGSQRSFVYDVADLYKTELAIPVAFANHQHAEPERVVRSTMRSQLRLLRLTRRIVSDIQAVIDPDSDNLPPSDDRERSQVTHLWDPDLGPLPDGTNYSYTAADHPF